mmetsp:Transcript_22769/g.36326  ORF Transcript_22769/g.36326 Transcript_22769/m.36326 type:complete len:375 (-) Transcript_22769:979-2103(-)|eukprot:CAMPEP_0203762586 /NCGR_PEP_ID=MMETSP0098-20131031/15435_1 /ASSEMBLY_ACC=CAM_ASM_000208 /TAXON_ID=96639 /ORGANISM=" , Strain NY0313808BC1" /LENGTH=374 /DNA_ID=CAMNT_0050657049 /DNA_START=490 /DNA_END=1614 /DNA_ORIENTATION=+
MFRDRLKALEDDMKELEHGELEQFSDVVKQNNSRLDFVKALLDSCDVATNSRDDDDALGIKLKHKTNRNSRPGYQRPTERSVSGSIRVSRAEYTDLKARLDQLEKQSDHEVETVARNMAENDVQARALRKAFGSLSELVVREMDSVRDEVVEANRINLHRIQCMQRKLEEIDILSRNQSKDIKRNQENQTRLEAEIGDIKSSLGDISKSIATGKQSCHGAKNALVDQLNQVVNFVARVDGENKDQLRTQKMQVEKVLERLVGENRTELKNFSQKTALSHYDLEKSIRSVNEKIQLMQVSIDSKIRKMNEETDSRFKEVASSGSRMDHCIFDIQRKLERLIEEYESYKKSLTRELTDYKTSVNGVREALRLLHNQ